MRLVVSFSPETTTLRPARQPWPRQTQSATPVCVQVRRYIMNAAFMDFSGERLLNVFNDQAAAMLATAADDLHALHVRAHFYMMHLL